MTGFCDSQGKSLVEILMVLAIVALMASLVGPVYSGILARSEAQSATAEIASQLRLARQLAMARRERLLVVFDPASRTISVQRADVAGMLGVYRYGDKGIVVEESTAGPRLFFHPTGRSATATTIVVRDKQNRATKLTVSLTGRIAVL
jgi:type IV fimbrial biogenesis protein FimT